MPVRRFLLLGGLVFLAAPEVVYPAAPAARGRMDRYGDPLPPGAIARIGTVRLRHPGAAHVLFGRGGNTLTSVGNGDLRVWDAASGKLLREPTTGHHLPPLFTGHPGALCSALSPGHRVLAVAAPDHHVSLHDAASGKLLWRMRTRWGNTAALAFSPDGKGLAARGVPESSVARWSLPSGKELPVLDAPPAEEPARDRRGSSDLGLAFSPDGKLLAAASRQSLCLWETRTGRLLLRRRGPPEDVLPCLAFSPDGERLAWGQGDSGIALLDVPTGKERRRLRGFPSSFLFSLAFAPGGKVLASVHDDSVRLWDVKSGKVLRRLKTDCLLGTAACFSADGRFLGLADGGRLRRWEVATGKERPSPAGLIGDVDSLAVSSNGRVLAVGAGDGTLGLWEATTGRPLSRLHRGEGLARWLTFSPDGRVLAAEETAGALAVWDVASGRRRRVFGGHRRDPAALAMMPDGWELLRADRHGEVCRWQGDTGKLLGRFAADRLKEGDADVGLSAAGGTLAVAEGKVVRCWDVRRGKGYPAYTAPGRAGVAAVSRDGKTVAVLTTHGKVVGEDDSNLLERLTLIEAVTGWPRGPARTLPDGAHPFAFSPGGEVLAFGVGHTVRLWETRTGKEVAPLRGHRGRVTALVFALSEKLLVSGGEDMTALVWDLTRVLPRRGPLDLSRRRRETLWARLRDGDAPRAYEAVCELSAAGAADFLGKRLRQAGRDEARARPRWRPLVADLGSEDFAVRQRAFEELGKAGDRAEPALRRALAGPLSPEARRRAESLLKRLKGAAPSAETLRIVRGVEALGRMGPAARRVLKALSEGAPEARLTQEAKAALRRLEAGRAAP